MAFNWKRILLVFHTHRPILDVRVQRDCLEISVLKSLHSLLDDTRVDKGKTDQSKSGGDMNEDSDDPQGDGIISESEDVVEDGAYEDEEMSCEIVEWR